ncbi:MAG: hypothetical protein CMJ39_11035 [Phycisphaerae bacterium]|nr:hypothetical protein [Phycisphaerae bacterium]
MIESRGNSMVSRAWAILALALSLLLLPGQSAEAQIRVASYNVAQLRGEPDALEAVLDELSLDDRTGPAHPVSIFVFQEVTQSTFDALSEMLGEEYSAGTYTNSGEDNYGGAQAMFYRADTLIEIASGHDGTYTGAGRRARRWQMRLLGYNDPVVDFYVYSGHLKAGTTSGSSEERVFGMTNILNNMGEIPPGSHIILCGDFNFYNSNEDGYQLMVGHESIDIVDPQGNSNWTTGSSAIRHTQSPRTISAGGLASGGLDDRFDFHVSTANMADGQGLAMIDGTNRSVGNDGLHYNDAINDGNNTYYPSDVPRSNTLADNLHDASDHLPVSADYMIPAVMSASMFNADIGTIISGASFEFSVNVANLCAPAYPAGGSSMSWYLDGTGGMANVVGSGNLDPDSSQWVQVLVTPGIEGDIDGDLIVRSDDDFVQAEPAVIPVTGTVLRHADASFSEESDINWNVVSDTFAADSGIQTIEVPLWNFGWDSQQASLDLDGVSGLDAPFVFAGGLVEGLTDGQATLSFTLDTDGMAPGLVVDALQILASDQDLPGAEDQVLNLSLTITIDEAPPSGCVGDIDGSGQTDVEDLLAVLDGFATLYDVDDLLEVIGDWGCTNP